MNTNPVWIIAKRELASYFDSLVAYILLIAFLAFTGLFTWISGSDIFFRKQADLLVFFSISYWTLFFFIPALTMRQLAEEKKTGTIELLLTKDVTDLQVIIGKFLSCLMMVSIALAFTLVYYVSVARIGNIDHGATICGYFGLFLMSGAYISIGLLASSLTNNQIVAFLTAILIGICFHFVFSFLASTTSGLAGQILDNLSLQTHFDSISRGVIDTKDLVYFASIIVIGLTLSAQVIAKR